jgi:hypothetical protein
MTDHNLGSRMQAMLLEIAGVFSYAQEQIELLTKIFLDQRLGNAAAIVAERTTGRINDEERLKLFLAIATELKTGAELSDFSAEYRIAKKFRDGVAHAAIFNLTESKLQYSKAFNQDSVYEASVPELHEMRRKCMWLLAQISYVLSSRLGEVTVEQPSGGRVRVYPVRPPAKAKDWQGLTMESFYRLTPEDA